MVIIFIDFKETFMQLWKLTPCDIEANIFPHMVFSYTALHRLSILIPRHFPQTVIGLLYFSD